MNMSREECVLLAKIAGEAGRYEEMADYMGEVVAISKGELTGNERELFSTAFKNLLASRIAAMRVISGVQNAEDDEVNLALVLDYRSKIVGEIAYYCCGQLKAVSSLMSSPSQDDKDLAMSMSNESLTYLAEEVADQKPPSLIFLEVDVIGRERHQFLATLADKLGRHQEMARMMENLALRSFHFNLQLTLEERNLLKLSFEKACLPLRAQWITIRCYEHQQHMLQDDNRNVLLIRDLRIKIEKEIETLSLTILRLLNRGLIPRSAVANDKMFYRQMVCYFKRFLPRNLAEHKPLGHGVVLHWVLNSGIHKLDWIRSHIGPRLFSLSMSEFKSSINETSKALLTIARKEIKKCGSIHGFSCAIVKLLEVYTNLTKTWKLVRCKRFRAIPKYKVIKFRIGKKFYRIKSKSKKRLEKVFFAVNAQVKWVACLVRHSRKFCQSLTSTSIADIADHQAAGNLFVSKWFTGSLIFDSYMEQDLAFELVEALLLDAGVPANKIVIPDELRIRISRDGKSVKKR